VACLPPKLELEPSDAGAGGGDEVLLVESSTEAPQSDSESARDDCVPKCDGHVCNVDDGCGATCTCPIGILCVAGVCPLN